MLAAAWYFVAGFVTLMLASGSHALSPWTMGLPFVIGQLLMAAILHFASGDLDAED
jgi:biotin transporter BioY